VTVGEGAFKGCLALEYAAFAQVSWDRAVFEACDRLQVVTVRSVVDVDEHALLGSNAHWVTSVPWLKEQRHTLDVVIPAADGCTTRVWTADATPALVAMTALTATGGRQIMTAAQRRLLGEVDLSALASLPPDLTLANSYFLRMARLPATTEEIPARFFCNCSLLLSINLDECTRLARIGLYAFSGCWRLQHLQLPQSCTHLDFTDSGVTHLDLRGTDLERAVVVRCGRLQRLILPHPFGGELAAEYNVSLQALSLGRAPRFSGTVRPREVRHFSMYSCVRPIRHPASTVRTLLGESAELNGREVRPSLPL
jgi:hypothetical protein